MGCKAQRPMGEHFSGIEAQEAGYSVSSQVCQFLALPGHIIATHHVCFLIVAENYVTLVEVCKTLGSR